MIPKDKEKIKDKGRFKRNNKKRGRMGKGAREKPAFDKEAWQPTTELGKKVKSGEVKDIDFILDNGLNILEAEIVEALIPELETDLLLIGQSKGKFGGGARRVFRQTQKKTREGNKPRFATVAVAGNANGYVGIGYGKSKETVPAREKSLRNAKLNIIKIRRGCGSWQCGCKEAHTIPYKVKGKCGSATIELIPAPKGTGLCIETECSKMLKMAGVTDIWSRKRGKTKSKLNLVLACFAALHELVKTKTKPADVENLGIVEGAIKAKNKSQVEPDIKEQDNKNG